MAFKQNIDVHQAKKIIQQHKNDPNFLLLDVRTMAEYGMSHIQGSKNISFFGFQGNINQLDKNKYYLVYCKSGGRSSSAAQSLRKNGFNNVTNMSGGIMTWNNNNYPTESSGCQIM